MANWCNSYLTFTGEEDQVKKVTELFKTMSNLESTTNEGQVPEFITEVEDDYFFGIYESELGVFQYETKWSPNMAEVVKISDYFNLSFVLEYEECGNDIFGKSIYNHETKKLTVKNLQPEDFEEVQYDCDGDYYIFRDQQDETDRNFLEDLYFERYNENY